MKGKDRYLLHQNGTLSIFSESTMPNEQLRHARQTIELDENHDITAIKLHPQTSLLYYAVQDKKGYSSIKSKNIPPQNRGKSKIL